MLPLATPVVSHEALGLALKGAAVRRWFGRSSSSLHHVRWYSTPRHLGVRDPPPIVGVQKNGATVLNMVVVVGGLAKPLPVRTCPVVFRSPVFDLLVPRPGGLAEHVPVACSTPQQKYRSGLPARKYWSSAA